MFDTFLVTPIRIFIWLIFLGTAYQFLLRNVWEGWRMNRIQHQLHDHIVVAGFGASGSEAVRELHPPRRPRRSRSSSSTAARRRSKRRRAAASRCSKATPPATPRSRR